MFLKSLKISDPKYDPGTFPFAHSTVIYLYNCFS